MCAYICMLEKPKYQNCDVWVYVWGDFDIHAKPKTWECGKYTHFVIVIFIFLLTVCSSMLSVVYICKWWNVWGCASAWDWKLSIWESESKTEKAFESADYTGIHVTWLTPSERLLFAQDKIKMRGCSWKNTARDYSVQSGSQNYLIYRHSTIFVSRKSKSWILFSAPRGHHWPFKNIQV